VARGTVQRVVPLQVDVRGKSAEGLAQYILGPPGSNVVLGFVRGNSPIRYVELTRGWTMKKSNQSQWSNPLPPNHALHAGALGPQ
jgi:hypothetical protein